MRLTRASSWQSLAYPLEPEELLEIARFHANKAGVHAHSLLSSAPNEITAHFPLRPPPSLLTLFHANGTALARKVPAGVPSVGPRPSRAPCGSVRFPAAPHARPPVLDTLNSRTVAFLGACWLRVSRLQGPPRGEGSGVPPPAPPGPPALPRPPPAGSPRAGEARVGRARPFSECPVTCSHFPREVFLMQPKRVNARCTCSR